MNALRLMPLVAVPLLLLSSAQGETITFKPAPADNLLNPERGLVGMFKVEPGTLNSLGTLRSDGMTVIRGLLFLDRKVNLENSQRLEEIRTWLARARAERVKVLLRVVYHEDKVRLPSKDVVDTVDRKEPDEAEYLAHLDDLKQTFHDFADVIMAHEAGVLGAYGEWYYTGHLDIDLRARLLDKYFEVIPSDAQLLLRSAFYKSQYEKKGASASRLARIGHYNDCFMSGSNGQEGYACLPDETGCPSAATWKAKIHADSARVLVGGETCTDLRNSCTQVASEMAYQGYSYIHPLWWNNKHDGHKTNFDYWKEILPSCEAGIRSRLGYRFELEKAEVPSAIDRKRPFKVSFTIRNTGYGTVTTPRPVRVKLLDANTHQELVFFDMKTDIRQWRPGEPVTVMRDDLEVPDWVVSRTKVTVALAIPDDATTLWQIPEYSIRVASRTSAGAPLWSTAGGGVNVLKANVPMTPAP